MSLVPFTLDPFFGEDLFFQPFRSSSLAKAGTSARGVATDVVEVSELGLVGRGPHAGMPGWRPERTPPATDSLPIPLICNTPCPCRRLTSL